MASKKKILVIGGGFAGLTSIKCLKEEGFDPVCYEKSSHCGGTWYYRQETPIGTASIMPTTVINHSKEMGALTNYVPDKSLPNYMRHHELLKFFNDVGKKFDCFRHITCNREVIKVTRSADYDETGRWDIKVKDTESGEISHETYDGVMVCTGHINRPKWASYPGMDKFTGKIIHTHSLKEVNDFKGKKVVVVGIGCSGLDAAVEISNVASQVYLSTRTGTWICPRVGQHGLPFDYIMLQRFAVYLMEILGHKYPSSYIEKRFLNTKFNHKLYNINPQHGYLSKDPAVNDVLPAKMISGAILARKDIRSFTEKGVIFQNEAKETEADVVVMATGYTWEFPFLEENTVKVEDGRINLYKCMYPPHLKHPSLVFIGFILPFGPGFPLGEMQCRWAAQVFNGKCLPPREEQMMEDIKKRHEKNLKRYAQSEKMTIRVDYVQYQDEIASMFGAKPSMWKLLFTDPVLFKALMFGPSLPYQYRLEGPHKWAEAREAILTAPERVGFPFGNSTGYFKDEKICCNSGSEALLRYIIVFLAILFCLPANNVGIKLHISVLILTFSIMIKGFKKRYLFSLVILLLYAYTGNLLSVYFRILTVPFIVAIFT